MNVQELRDALDGLDGDMEIRMATQPSYPLQSHIDDEVRVVKGIAYIREASQVYDAPYAPGPVYGEYDDSGDDDCHMCGRSLSEDVDRVLGDCVACNPTGFERSDNCPTCGRSTSDGARGDCLACNPKTLR